MKITRIGSQPSGKGPPEYFTGAVRIDTRFEGSAPARVEGAIVTFAPGARTAPGGTLEGAHDPRADGGAARMAHSSLGQTLTVTAGCGWVQSEGGAIEEIRPGDVVWFPPGVKHWHGGTATQGMTHIAISEALNGKTVDWMVPAIRKLD